MPGIPLGSSRLSTTEVSGLATALGALHDAVPPDELRSLEHRQWDAGAFTTAVGTLLSEAACAGTAPDVVRALTLARTWFDTNPLDTTVPEGDRVFGIADGNLANYLWDGDRVRLVDFEDAGVSDRCYELADTIEHPSAFVDDTLDPEALVGALDLDDDQRSRVLGYRRLFACFWLVRLLPGGPAHHRNPPGTLEKYSTRATALLSAGPRPARCDE
ncbi:MAG: phosphotransferase family protein [Nocardioidaceae bacterium]